MRFFGKIPPKTIFYNKKCRKNRIKLRKYLHVSFFLCNFAAKLVNIF